ncbi:UNVERIFIED_ORG: hypothetical protein E4P37_08640 [Bacillus sp. AZ43]
MSSLVEERDGVFFIKYTLVNGGDYPIDNVVLVVADLVADCVPQEQRGCALELVVGTMYQKQVIEDEAAVRLRGAPAFAEITALGSILFTDSWGQSWWRGPGQLQLRDVPARVC